jgi:hypothetical protein
VVVGDQVSVPFTGNVLFNNVTVSVTPGLPKTAGHHLAAGTGVPFTVNITNNGAAPQLFFIDARLNTSTALALATQFGTSGTVSLPLRSYIYWLVPTQTSTVSVAATGSLPIMFDYSPAIGDPDLESFGSGCSTSPSASYTPSGGSVAAGLWNAYPDECGPYPGPAPSGTASIAMTATAKAFDSAVTSDTSDFWLEVLDPSAPFAPIQINPGASATINVTITPSGPSGTVVSGALYVDVFVDNVPAYGQDSGDELAVFPYEYTIK